MNTPDSQILIGYEDAHRAAAFYPIPQAGYLQVKGQDRHEFIQRQTTNDIQQISQERAVITVLTSSTARILDLLILIDEPDALGTITLPGYAQKTAGFLKSRIFFLDKVNLDDCSSAFSQLDLIGPRSSDILHLLGLTEIPEKGTVATEEISAEIVKVIALDENRYRLIFPSTIFDFIEEILLQDGAKRLIADSYAVLQVEAGLPQPGHELIDEFTPMEVNLETAISTQKGCYTGQEVIARQLTYDKVTRRMVGIKLNSLAKPGDQIYSPDQKAPIGKLTSMVASPRYGQIGLAVIKRPFNQPGSQIVVSGQDYSLPGSVCALPFND